MSKSWDDSETTVNDRYKPLQKLGQGTFGVVFLAKFQGIPEPHPCLLGDNADLSAKLRGHMIPDVVDLDADVSETNMVDTKRSIPSDAKSNLLERSDLALGFQHDWWRKIVARGTAEEVGTRMMTAASQTRTYDEADVYKQETEGKRGREVYAYECEELSKRLPKLGSSVAIKKMNRDPKLGHTFGLEPLREVRSLVETRHPHIVQIHEVFLEQEALHLVMEVLKSNLDKVIKDTSILLSAGDVKQYMRMTLLALTYLHGQGVCHRDLKPENLLIGDDGVLKLADFGGTKPCGTPEVMSPQACTIWYRAPELLLGSQSYGTASDIWSAGCIFGELFRRSALFQGSNNMDQLAQIVSVCGNPTEDNWPGVTSLAGYVEFEPTQPVPLKELFGTCSPASLDLLASMLSLDPRHRPTAEEALSHPYFTTEAPPATPVNMLPRAGGTK